MIECVKSGCLYKNIFIKGLFSARLDKISKAGEDSLKESVEQNIYEVTLDNVTGTPEQKADKLWRKFLLDHNITSSEMVAYQCKDYKNNEYVLKAYEYATNDQLALWKPLIEKSYQDMLRRLVDANNRNLQGEIGRITIERLREISNKMEIDSFYSQRSEALELLINDSDTHCKEYAKSVDKFCRVYNNVLDKVSLKKGLSKFKGDTFYVPYGITEINFGAFAGCDCISKVVLPSTVKKINYNAFRDCKTIKSVVMLGVEEIGEWAFWGCEKLESIVFKESLKSIGENAFWQCGNLTVYSLDKEQGKNWSHSWNVVNDELSKSVKTLWSGQWQIRDGVLYEDTREIE